MFVLFVCTVLRPAPSCFRVPEDTLRMDPAAHTMHELLPARSTAPQPHATQARAASLASLSVAAEASRREPCMSEAPEPLVYAPAPQDTHALLPAGSSQWLSSGPLCISSMLQSRADRGLRYWPDAFENEPISHAAQLKLPAPPFQIINRCFGLRLTCTSF